MNDSKIIKTILSCENDRQFRAVSDWLDRLYDIKIIDDVRYLLFTKIVVETLEKEMEITKRKISSFIYNFRSISPPILSEAI